LIQKKVCMLGAFAVGKTSLVARYVESIFSERYHTTVGVKVDKKVVSLDRGEVTLMLWDLYGEDEFQPLSDAYFRGMSGYLLVVDGTRRATLEKALELHARIVESVGEVPFVCALNKSDLASEWEIGLADEKRIEALQGSLIRTSAKSGAGVEDAFTRLAQRMTEADA
jgi:small GTP-binding protein